MYVPDLAGPKLWLWSGESPGLVDNKKKKKKGRLSLRRTQASFASERFSACLRKNKEHITRDAEVCAAITQKQRRVTFPEIDPRLFIVKKKKRKVSCGIFVK